MKFNFAWVAHLDKSGIANDFSETGREWWQCHTTLESETIVTGGELAAGSQGFRSFVHKFVRRHTVPPSRSFHLGLWVLKKHVQPVFRPVSNLVVLSAIIMSLCLGNNDAVIKALLHQFRTFRTFYRERKRSAIRNAIHCCRKISRAFPEKYKTLKSVPFDFRYRRHARLISIFI